MHLTIDTKKKVTNYNNTLKESESESDSDKERANHKPVFTRGGLTYSQLYMSTHMEPSISKLIMMKT